MAKCQERASHFKEVGMIKQETINTEYLVLLRVTDKELFKAVINDKNHKLQFKWSYPDFSRWIISTCT